MIYMVGSFGHYLDKGIIYEDSSGAPLWGERRPGLLGLYPYLHMMIKVDSKSPPAPGRSPRLPHHYLHENMVYVDNHSPSLGGERGPGLLGRFLYFHMIYKVGSKLPPARGR